MKTILLALLFMAGGGDAAMLPPPLAALFAADHGVRLDGPALRLKPDGGPAIRLTPVRYAPPAGRSELVNGYRCAILLVQEGGRPIAVETVGSGETEALSCDGLVAAGLVGASLRPPRIVLVYRTRSPNERSRTPIIVRRDSVTARWTVDDALSSRLADRLDTVTIPAIRLALKRH